MKKIISLLFLSLFISCSGEDNQPGNSALNGEWYLVNISCFCGFSEEIDLSEFKLYFDTSENRVRLENPTEDYYYITAEGTYPYRLEEDTLLIEGAEPFKYKIEGSDLTLTLVDVLQIADDELVLVYKKK